VRPSYVFKGAKETILLVTSETFVRLYQLVSVYMEWNGLTKILGRLGFLIKEFFFFIRIRPSLRSSPVGKIAKKTV